jgi:NAD(P)-dependent dehydrogenase (short-subunit alcohol dehydrogenase family)
MAGLRGLAGRVAVVTGAAGGIGSATARRLAAEGVRVVAVDINEQGARAVAQSLPEPSAWVGVLSDDAAYITGEVVSADGGASIVSSVRPSGGAGAWDTAAHDAALYGAGGMGPGWRERR